MTAPGPTTVEPGRSLDPVEFSVMQTAVLVANFNDQHVAFESERSGLFRTGVARVQAALNDVKALSVHAMCLCDWRFCGSDKCR